jgi:sugar lactone lactonase YvrE
MQRTLFIATMMTLTAVTNATEPVVQVLIGSHDANPGKTIAPGKLSFPFGIDFDSAGNMIIVEYKGGRIFKQTPMGELLQIGGLGNAGYEGDGGPVSEASFNNMHNVAIGPDDSLYISDHANHAIRRVDSIGNVSTYAGGTAGFAGDGKTVEHAKFNMAISASISPDKKYLLVADIKNRRIRRITLATGHIETIAGNGDRGIPRDNALATMAPLVDPRAAAYDEAGNLYIVERSGNALRVIDTAGKVRTVAGSGKKGRADGAGKNATLNGPKHLAIDPSGVAYIADDNNNLVRCFDPNTGVLTTVLGAGEFKLNRPHGVQVHDGWLYIADSWHHRVVRLKLATK